MGSHDTHSFFNFAKALPNEDNLLRSVKLSAIIRKVDKTATR